MGSISKTALIFWESTSLIDILKQKVGMAPSPSALLLQKVAAATLSSSSYRTLFQVFAYLADHSHSQLEQALKDKMAQAKDHEVKSVLRAVTTFSLSTGRLKMLDVCQRVVSLDPLKKAFDITDVKLLAQREATFIFKPTRTIEKISGILSQYWQQYSGVFGKIINCFNIAIIGSVTTIGYMVTNPLLNPPSSVYEVNKYFGVFYSIFRTTIYVSTAYLKFFSSAQKAAIAAMLISTSVAGVLYIHKRFHLGIPEQIDAKGYFKNESLKAKNGELKKMRGRLIEKEIVERCWNVTPGDKFRIALVKGSPGTGKSEFGQGLAWESVYDDLSFVYEKYVFIVNAALLVAGAEAYMNEVIRKIGKYKNDVVLIFDEGHCVGSQDALIEYLKTNILDIRCIFLTTPKEFDSLLAINKPFIDRCKVIDFDELPDEETIEILRNKASLDQIDVDPSAYNEILHVAKKHPDYLPRVKPRKVIDVYNDVRSDVHSWTPKELKRRLGALTSKRDRLEDGCSRANDVNPYWSTSKEGIAMIATLEEMNTAIGNLNKKIADQNSAHKNIKRLQELKPVLQKEYNQLVHVIANQTIKEEKVHKRFLFLKYILRPILRDLIQAEAANFMVAYKEEVPLTVDANLIKHLYSSLYQSHTVAPANSNSHWNGC